MNWIDFKKEKPKANPSRQVLVKYRGNVYGVAFTDSVAIERDSIDFWAEIEPPQNLDPFQEFIKTLPDSLFDVGAANTAEETIKALQSCWDAAIKYAKGEK